MSAVCHPLSAFSYRIVSAEIVAATPVVRHARSLAHDETLSALAAFHAVGHVAVRGGRQVAAGGGASGHARVICAVGAAGKDWGRQKGPRQRSHFQSNLTNPQTFNPSTMPMSIFLYCAFYIEIYIYI